MRAIMLSRWLAARVVGLVGGSIGESRPCHRQLNLLAWRKYDICLGDRMDTPVRQRGSGDTPVGGAAMVGGVIAEPSFHDERVLSSGRESRLP